MYMFAVPVEEGRGETSWINVSFCCIHSCEVAIHGLLSYGLKLFSYSSFFSYANPKYLCVCVSIYIYIYIYIYMLTCAKQYRFTAVCNINCVETSVHRRYVIKRFSSCWNDFQLTIFYWCNSSHHMLRGWPISKDELDGTCATQQGEDMCIRGFSLKTWTKGHAQKT
jgi:hypothetical protein